MGDLAGSFAVWVETLLPVKQSDVEALHWVCSPQLSVHGYWSRIRSVRVQSGYNQSTAV